MIPKIAAASVLLASGIAAAQQDPFNGSGFQNVFTEASTRVFVIGRFDDIIGSATYRAADNRPMPPLVLDPAIFDEQQSLIGVEGDGVRLPDEQFSLP